jgi:hypothetical protein
MRKNNFDADAMAKAGRERAALELDDLRADWVSTCKRWAFSHGATVSRELNDFSAKFQLRNIELPFYQVREEQRAVVEEMLKAGSENSGVVQAVADLLNELDRPSTESTAMIPALTISKSLSKSNARQQITRTELSLPRASRPASNSPIVEIID